MSLVALKYVESSWTRDLAGVTCFGRWMLYHWTTKGVPQNFQNEKEFTSVCQGCVPRMSVKSRENHYMTSEQRKHKSSIYKLKYCYIIHDCKMFVVGMINQIV